jgi:hypothetical protein
MVEIFKIALTVSYWLEYSGAWRVFGVSVNSLETRNFRFINLNALIVARNIQEKPEGILSEI